MYKIDIQNPDNYIERKLYEICIWVVWWVKGLRYFFLKWKINNIRRKEVPSTPQCKGMYLHFTKLIILSKFLHNNVPIFKLDASLSTIYWVRLVNLSICISCNNKTCSNRNYIMNSFWQKTGCNWNLRKDIFRFSRKN